MSKGFAVTRDGLIRYASQLRVAKDGIVRAPVRALVSCGGVAREFWPSNLDPALEGIQLTPNPITAQDIRREGGAVPENPPPEQPPALPPDPTPNPPPPADSSSVPWYSVFGSYFGTVTTSRFQDIIPNEGLFVTFVVDSRQPPSAMLIRTIQVATASTVRRVAVAESAGDFTGLGWQNQAAGQNLMIRMNGSTQTASGQSVYVDVGPGRYYLNLKNDPLVSPNWMRTEAIYGVQ